MLPNVPTDMNRARHPRLLGISASLRNARWGRGSERLIEELHGIPDWEGLLDYLREQSDLHLENFLTAGRAKGADFQEIYVNLAKLSGDKGLSNSEVALAAGLWAASQQDIAIQHLSLGAHFKANGSERDTETLAAALLEADAVLISGPVYFGDRGSLAESLLDFLARYPELLEAMRGKLYGGIAVGAKRNGGQETTLVYQMMDMLDLGFLAVGNDSDTTAQYGGTGVAGDVGTMARDEYGLETAAGVGRRLGQLLPALTSDAELADRTNALFVVLQDSEHVGVQMAREMADHFRETANCEVVDVSVRNIRRCIACDICPTHIDVDEAYRCIISSSGDEMADLHPKLLDYDVLIPVVVTSEDRRALTSRYQAFMERTRYLRRGDYVFSDLLVVPWLISRDGAVGTYLMRMMTSFIRHHTVLHRPVTSFSPDGCLPDRDMNRFKDAFENARRLTAGRLAQIESQRSIQYNPVGYILSADKELEDERLNKRQRAISSREQRFLNDARRRLKPK